MADSVHVVKSFRFQPLLHLPDPKFQEQQRVSPMQPL